MTSLPVRPEQARHFGYAHVIASVAGVGFFVLSFVLLAVLPGQRLRQQIAETAPADMAPYSAAEKHGAAIFAREGCTNCHSEQVRFVSADVARWGAPTEAWETQYDYPQLWGTRRTGPDLAREAGVRPNDWQRVHLYNPRLTVSDSIMPSYPWLFEGGPDHPTEEGRDLVAYLQSLGRARQVSGYDLAALPPNAMASGMGPATDPALLGRSDANAARATIDGPARRFAATLPEADWAAAVVHGAELFAHHCASCHGNAGSGDGPAANGLMPHPANLQATTFSNERISSALWDGVAGSSMPAWRDLSGYDLASLVAYVQTLSRVLAPPPVTAAEDLAQGQTVFEKNCTSCHGTDGAGDGPASRTIAPAPTNFHLEQPSTQRALEVLAHGSPGTSMPSWRTALSDVEQHEVVAYLRSFFVSGQQAPGGTP
jgi:cytochrome c oxidase cbb3-type subunit II